MLYFVAGKLRLPQFWFHRKQRRTWFCLDPVCPRIAGTSL